MKIKLNGKECYCDKEIFEYIVKSDDEKEIITIKYNQALEVAQDRFKIIQKAISYMEKDMIDREINCYRINQIDVKKLLEILKGEE